MTPGLQEWIHRFEVGEGTRTLRFVLGLLVLLALAVAYLYLESRNLSQPEAMDAAQLARNLARGDGFTTQFIRPSSIALLERQAHDARSLTNDPAFLGRPHPDLAQAPLYPLYLAGVFKIFPPDAEIPRGRLFWRFPPDERVAQANTALLIALVVLVFVLARKWFDEPVAWTAALVVAGTLLFWQLAASGLPTILLMLLFTVLTGVLVTLEHAGRAESPTPTALITRALVAGALVGLCGLTRYAALVLIIPVMVYLVAFVPRHRAWVATAALAGCCVVVVPWMLRNMALAGNPFGVAIQSLAQATPAFPDDTLSRSLQWDWGMLNPRLLVRKLVANLGPILQTGIPALGGSWIAALFLAGLLVGFVDPGRNRLRLFLVVSLAVLAVAQALGIQAAPIGADPGLADNLVVVTAPVIFIYGAALVEILLHQADWVAPPVRRAVVGVVVGLAWLPLGLALLPPRPDPRVHPPYYPPLIQQLGGWMDPAELTMTDIPWALAWYGDRRGVWTTLHARSRAGEDQDFFAINDLRHPVHALYLSPVTLDRPFFTDTFEGTNESWGRFAVNVLLKTNLPPGFPLKSAHGGAVQRGHLFLTDWPRWNRPGGSASRPADRGE